MTRLFDEHIVRKSASLSGVWKFKVDREDFGIAESWFSGLTDAESTVIPSMWNDEQGLLSHESAVWYEKKVLHGRWLSPLYI